MRFRDQLKRPNFPESWRAKLKHRELITDLALKLWKLSR